MHGFWRELPNYNAIGVQSSGPGTQHALDAEALFTPAQADEDLFAPAQVAGEDEDLEDRLGDSLLDSESGGDEDHNHGSMDVSSFFFDTYVN